MSAPAALTLEQGMSHLGSVVGERGTIVGAGRDDCGTIVAAPADVRADCGSFAVRQRAMAER